MKNLFLTALTLLTAVTASADRFGDRDRRNDRDSRRIACSCRELDRRLNGLETALRVLRLSSYEANAIERDIRDGEYYQRQVSPRDDVNEQNRLCSSGNQAVDSSWSDVQPRLARLGLDRPVYCN